MFTYKMGISTVDIGSEQIVFVKNGNILQGFEKLTSKLHVKHDVIFSDNVLIFLYFFSFTFPYLNIFCWNI